MAHTPGIDLKVYFGMLPDADQQGVDFGVSFQWDVPLLDGYHWEVLVNNAKTPSLGTFAGISTPGIGRAIRAWRPTMAVVTGWQSRMLIQAFWACRRLRMPLLARGDSNALAPRSRWKKALHRLWLRQFNGFLAVGDANCRFYLQAGVHPRRIFYCPHFVDNERFCQLANVYSEEQLTLRRQWGIPPKSICFLYAGKLVPKKRIFDLLKALDIAKSQHPGLHLLIAGAGELETQARGICGHSQSSNKFCGIPLNQTEIAKAYAVADCLVLPSDYGETWGLVVNVAMACGLPAVISDRVGCGPDLVKEGITGKNFPFGDIDALAASLVMLASDPGHLQQMGKNARELIFRDYSVEKAVEGTLAAVKATLSVGQH
ncbi:MAG: glycosyltransferase family 4 protein [Candidatus Competibacteraceae bacterium]